jgi:drug/metabolite transporter (DMT)-like permease
MDAFLKEKIVKFKRDSAGYVYAILATAIWSGNFVIARGLSDSISPVNLAFFRWATALLFFLPFALKSLIKDISIVRKNLLYFILTSILGVTLFNTLIYFAGHTSTAMNLSLISITFPVFIIIISRLFFGEKIKLNKGIGIVLVGFGVVTLITKGDFLVLKNLSFSKGDLLMVGAALTFAVYSILLKKKPENISLFAFQLACFIIGLIFLFPFFIYENIGKEIILPSMETVYSILYVGIFASLTAFVLWNKAILTIGPAKSGMVYYTLPLFCGLLAFLFLNEPIGLVHLFSAFLILPGIIIANYEPHHDREDSSLKEEARKAA